MCVTESGQQEVLRHGGMAALIRQLTRYGDGDQELSKAVKYVLQTCVVHSGTLISVLAGCNSMAYFLCHSMYSWHNVNLSIYLGVYVPLDSLHDI